MILEIYLTIFILMIIMFFVAYFMRQELVWIITMALSGILMFSSYGIEILGYTYENVTNSYVVSTSLFSYPYLAGINLIFFALSLLLGFYDIFDKFNNK